MTAQELVQRLAGETRGHADYTTSAVYAWESGRNMLPERLIPVLAGILGCAQAELLPSFRNSLPEEPCIQPTMDQIRKSPGTAFIGSNIGMVDMAELIWAAGSSDWPPE